MTVPASLDRSVDPGCQASKCLSDKPSQLDRDWQRIRDRLQVLLSRMAAAAGGEQVTDEQMRSFESVAGKVARDMQDLRRKLTDHGYDVQLSPMQQPQQQEQSRQDRSVTP